MINSPVILAELLGEARGLGATGVHARFGRSSTCTTSKSREHWQDLGRQSGVRRFKSKGPGFADGAKILYGKRTPAALNRVILTSLFLAANELWMHPCGFGCFHDVKVSRSVDQHGERAEPKMTE